MQSEEENVAPAMLLDVYIFVRGAILNFSFRALACELSLRYCMAVR